MNAHLSRHPVAAALLLAAVAGCGRDAAEPTAVAPPAVTPPHRLLNASGHHVATSHSVVWGRLTGGDAASTQGEDGAAVVLEEVRDASDEPRVHARWTLPSVPPGDYLLRVVARRTAKESNDLYDITRVNFAGAAAEPPGHTYCTISTAYLPCEHVVAVRGPDPVVEISDNLGGNGTSAGIVDEAVDKLEVDYIALIPAPAIPPAGFTVLRPSVSGPVAEPGDEVRNLWGAAGSWRYFAVEVAPGTTRLAVHTGTPQSAFFDPIDNVSYWNGDVAVSVRVGALPTDELYDARQQSFGPGTGGMSLDLWSPPAGDTVYIGVKGLASFLHWSLWSIAYPAAALDAIAPSPTSLVGGEMVWVAAILNTAAPQEGASVPVTSSHPDVIPSYTFSIPPGYSSQGHWFGTARVVSRVTVTLTGTYAGVTRSASVVVDPPAPADVVTVGRAEHDGSRGVLQVEASSTLATATLNVYVASTGALIGPLAGDGEGRYRGSLMWGSNPGTIRVVSSAGGSATASVTSK